MFLPTPFVMAAPTEIVSAQVERAGANDYLNGIRAELGLASPVGMAGISVWRDVAPAFRLEGGVGAGLSGLQLSALGRFLLGGPNHRFVPGIGVSLGVPVGATLVPWGGYRAESGRVDVVIPWLNVDALGYEYESNGGWTFLAAAGATTSLQNADWGGKEFGGPLRPFRDWYPEVHLAFGRAF